MTAPAKKRRTDNRGALKFDAMAVRMPVKLDAPTRITNAGSSGRYVPPAWPVREGADDHKRFRSRGIGA